MANAIRASRAAITALLSMASTTVTAPLRRSLPLAGALPVQFVEQFAEVLAVLRGQLLRANEVCQERCQVAVVEFVRRLLQTFPGELLALQDGAVVVRPLGPVAGDAPLFLQTVEQLPDRGEKRRRSVAVERLS